MEFGLKWHKKSVQNMLKLEAQKGTLCQFWKLKKDTLCQSWKLKKGTLSSGASPVFPSMGVPPPPLGT